MTTQLALDGDRLSQMRRPFSALGILSILACAPADWAKSDSVFGAWSFQLSDSTGAHSATVQAMLQHPVGGEQARNPHSIVGVFGTPPVALLKSLPHGDSLDGYSVRSDSLWVRLGRGGDAGEIEIHLHHTAQGWRGRWCQVFYAGGPCGSASGLQPRK